MLQEGSSEIEKLTESHAHLSKKVEVFPGARVISNAAIADCLNLICQNKSDVFPREVPIARRGVQLQRVFEVIASD